MTTSTKRTAPKLEDLMKAFNPSLSEKEIAVRVKAANATFQVKDTTPKGYEPA